MVKTTVVNLFGAPAAGKSTLAAKLFSILKEQGKNCELVREFVKVRAYEGRQVTPLDQIYLLGKQVHSESMLYGKVEYIITDSPFLLPGAYQHLFFSGDYIQKAAQAVMKEARVNYGIVYKNFLLPMRDEVKDEGRFHSKDQVILIDKYLSTYLALCDEFVINLDLENQIDSILLSLGE